jgi:hypothetical protein
MRWTTTAVIRRAEQWTVQAESSVGEAAELDCTSESQARYFAAVLALGPSALPKAAIVRRLGQLAAADRDRI